MTSFPPSKLFKNDAFLLSLVFISMLTAPAAAFQFRVGGMHGWYKPTGNESETYNQWASKNRFHIGDSIYFKYQNDSVLVVNETSYNECNDTNPIFKFKDGETVFQFDRYGFFYFISGKYEHCKAGQKLIIRVMVHPAIGSPGPAPRPGPSGGGGSGWDRFWGPPLLQPNSTVKLTFASYVMTALGGMLVIMSLLQ